MSRLPPSILPSQRLFNHRDLVRVQPKQGIDPRRIPARPVRVCLSGGGGEAPARLAALCEDDARSPCAHSPLKPESNPDPSAG
jgi:hypothetical protein